MAGRRREVGEINAGSMADIAFLLLIFFLVTTTMDTDVGIMRGLPPLPPPDFDPPPVKERNVYVVLANASNNLLVENEYMNIADLKDGAKEFLMNPRNSDELPEKREVTTDLCEEKITSIRVALETEEDAQIISELTESLDKWTARLEAVGLLGTYTDHPKSVISLQNDRGTSYDLYIQVQNELSAAVRELRDEFCRDKFGIPYDKLDQKNEEDKKKIKAIRQVIPQRISEAEPFQAN